MNKIILFWASSWIVLLFCFLPFPFTVLPDVGFWLSKLIYPLNNAVCLRFGVDVQHSYLVSDSLAFYSTSGILVLVSGLLTAFIAWKWKEQLAKIQTVLFVALILFLSYFLTRYGLDKLFGMQFYTPAANTLHTPVGHLGKDILFWTSMGTSSFYNAFMALTEVSAGILLLFNRTRFLGLITGFGILLNVFAINIGFDITVKYLSGLLLASSLLCLCFYSSRIHFLLGATANERPVPHVSQLWILVLFLPFLIDLFATYRHITPKDPGRSYAVESVSGTSRLIDPEEIIRIHFHPEGYFITESKQQEFTSFKLSNNRQSVIVDKQLIPISIKGNQLSWKEEENEITWHIKETNLEKMELKQDKTHWYFEAIKDLHQE